MSLTHRAYLVDGMFCDDCVWSLRRGIGDIPGVTAVGAHWPTRRVAVIGGFFDEGAVATAVRESGFRLLRGSDGRRGTSDGS